MSEDKLELPGSFKVEGREFIYVEALVTEDFFNVMKKIFEFGPSPKSSGSMEEKVRILLPNKKSLMAISYKGDLSGWKALIIGYCSANNKIWAILQDQKFILSNGKEIPVSDCIIEVEK